MSGAHTLPLTCPPKSRNRTSHKCQMHLLSEICTRTTLSSFNFFYVRVFIKCSLSFKIACFFPETPPPYFLVSTPRSLCPSDQLWASFWHHGQTSCGSPSVPRAVGEGFAFLAYVDGLRLRTRQGQASNNCALMPPFRGPSAQPPPEAPMHLQVVNRPHIVTPLAVAVLYCGGLNREVV